MVWGKSAWRSESLGERREVHLSQGTLRYHERGSGPPIVFVHGLLANANLWRNVVERLAPDFRCIALDLPLGSHTLPISENADLTPTGVADLIADAIESLGLEEVTLVGNDTGGALCQLVVTSRPERIGRLVLTSCDAFEHFPPAMFAYLKPVARIPGAAQVLFGPLRLRAPRRLPFAYGWLTKRPIDPEAEDSYVLPVLSDSEVRRDVRRFIGNIDKRYTLDAAAELGRFERPVLIAWSQDDRFFPADDAERLARTFPNARLEWIEDARTFSAEDQPERLAELIAGFVRQAAASEAAGP